MINQKGITLIELLIYMILFGIVVIMIQSQYVRMAHIAHREKQITDIQMKSRSLLSILQNDIKNMGCKIYFTDADDGFNKNINTMVFLNDSSSFICKEGNTSDTLKIYKTVLSSIGELDRTDSAQFYLSGDSLIRERYDNKNFIQKGIYALQFQYGVTISDSMIFDIYPLSFPDNWKVYNITGITPSTQINTFSFKVLFSDAAIGRIYYDTPFNITKDQQFKISIWLSSTSSIINNIDSVYCSFYVGDTRIGYDKFIPHDLKIDIMVKVPQNDGVKIAIDYWVTSAGYFVIEGMEIQRVSDGEFVWLDDPPENKKKLVKAIRVKVLNRSKNKSNIEPLNETPIEIANISYPRSGRYIWRFFEEVIYTPNNGAF